MGKLALGFLFVLSLVGCSDSKLPKSSNLDRLRVLTILSEESAGGGQTYAEFIPGSVVTLRPLISDLNGTGALTYEAAACIDPGVAFGAQPTCVGNATIQNITAGPQAVTLGSLTDRTGFADSFTVTVPASSLVFAGKSAIEQFNGVAYLVTYTLARADGATQTSFKRLIISTRTVRNKNPILSDLLSNGAALASLPVAGKVNLSPSFGAVGAESYQVQKADGSYEDRNETLVTSWFISDGELKFLRTSSIDSTEYTGPDAAPTTRKAFVIGVTRDERGGASAVIKSFP